MPWWLLLILVTIVWVLLMMASMARLAMEDARRGVPENERRGVSCLPVFPVVPLVMWGVALLIDLIAEPWGTWIIVSLHTVLLVAVTGSLVWYWWRHRSPDKVR